uniref:Phosphatidate cytidylyltransferase n=1 Tax=Guillardia theta TaxID=55529 RepID=A0A6U5WPQ1_GUITH|mmetsp:Transcript_14366/g.49082  ORF Transcript_14366/g.49082 Transcript_14366/m.49082 type:complete len:407 (+) Transcript_14366:263-1483(+)
MASMSRVSQLQNEKPISQSRKLLALLSLLSLVSTFLAPLLVHKLLPFTLGSRVLLSDSLQPLYTGELTLSNLSCFLFYTCWLRVTSLAVNPRHKIRLETAANWISPVVIMNAFFPLIFQIFLIVISCYGLQEYGDIMERGYQKDNSEHNTTTTETTTSSTSPSSSTTPAALSTSASSTWPKMHEISRCLRLHSLNLLIGGSSLFGSWTFFVGSIFFSLFVLVVSSSSDRQTLRESGRLRVLGLMYVSVMSGLANMLCFGPNGHGWILVCLSCSWIGDGGAYFIGGKYGRHKCHPAVSAGKSWEGIFAEGFWAIVTCFGIRWIQLSWREGYMEIPSLSASDCLIVGSLLTASGVAGDLCESLLKRLGGAKDSGDFFPGHGGVLDRFDGIYFSVLVVSLRLYFNESTK